MERHPKFVTRVIGSQSLCMVGILNWYNNKTKTENMMILKLDNHNQIECSAKTDLFSTSSCNHVGSRNGQEHEGIARVIADDRAGSCSSQKQSQTNKYSKQRHIRKEIDYPRQRAPESCSDREPQYQWDPSMDRRSKAPSQGLRIERSPSPVSK